MTHRPPRTLVFGIGCSRQCAEDYAQSGGKRALLATAPPTLALAQTPAADLRSAGTDVVVWPGVDREPTVGWENPLRRAGPGNRGPGRRGRLGGAA